MKDKPELFNLVTRTATSMLSKYYSTEIIKSFIIILLY